MCKSIQLFDDVLYIKHLYNYKYAIPREQVEIRSSDRQCGSRRILPI